MGLKHEWYDDGDLSRDAENALLWQRFRPGGVWRPRDVVSVRWVQGKKKRGWKITYYDPPRARPREQGADPCAPS